MRADIPKGSDAGLFADGWLRYGQVGLQDIVQWDMVPRSGGVNHCSTV